MGNSKITDFDLKTSIQICMEKFFMSKQHKVAQNISKKILKFANVECNISEYQYDFPLQVTWKITSSCNLRCIHCFFQQNEDNYNSDNDLNTQKILELIDEFADMNIISLILTGGEVLLTKDIIKILKKVKSKNIAVSISTNATLINKDLALQLGKILNPVMDNVQVSLDGSKKETHDKIRGIGSFDKAIKGIKNLLSVGIHPTINCTVTNLNINELSNLYQLTKDLQAKKLSIYKIIPFSNSQQELVPDSENLFRSIAGLIAMEKEFDMPDLDNHAFALHDFVNNNIARKFLPDFVQLPTQKQNVNLTCHNNDKAYIDSDGSVYLCNAAALDTKNAIGNIKNMTFSDVWNQRCNNLFFQKRDSSSMVCNKCSYHLFCKGGCTANAYQKYNNINAPDSNCDYGNTLMTK